MSKSPYGELEKRFERMHILRDSVTALEWDASTFMPEGGAQARADQANLTTLVAQDRNALNLLVGAPVDDADLPVSIESVDGLLAPLPAGLDSRILLRRPDVVEAEYTLRAANARIGAARAAFFPTISLTAAAGFASSALSSLFDHGNFTWSVAPTLMPRVAGAELTVRRPARIQSWASRREASPARASTFCRRSGSAPQQEIPYAPGGLDTLFDPGHERDAYVARARVAAPGIPPQVAAGQYRNVLLREQLAREAFVILTQLTPEVEGPLGSGNRQ